MGVMLFTRPLKGRVSDSKELRKLDGDDIAFGALEVLFLGEPGEPGRPKASSSPGSKLLLPLLLLLLLDLFLGKNDNSDAGIRMMERTWPSEAGWLDTARGRGTE